MRSAGPGGADPGTFSYESGTPMFIVKIDDHEETALRGDYYDKVWWHEPEIST